MSPRVAGASRKSTYFTLRRSTSESGTKQSPTVPVRYRFPYRVAVSFWSKLPASAKSSLFVYQRGKVLKVFMYVQYVQYGTTVLYYRYVLNQTMQIEPVNLKRVPAYLQSCLTTPEMLWQLVRPRHAFE